MGGNFENFEDSAKITNVSSPLSISNSNSIYSSPELKAASPPSRFFTIARSNSAHFDERKITASSNVFGGAISGGGVTGLF
jgi:hypothetical protein